MTKYSGACCGCGFDWVSIAMIRHKLAVPVTVFSVIVFGMAAANASTEYKVNTFFTGGDYKPDATCLMNHSGSQNALAYGVIQFISFLLMRKYRPDAKKVGRDEKMQVIAFAYKTNLILGVVALLNFMSMLTYGVDFTSEFQGGRPCNSTIFDVQPFSNPCTLGSIQAVNDVKDKCMSHTNDDLSAASTCDLSAPSEWIVVMVFLGLCLPFNYLIAISCLQTTIKVNQAVAKEAEEQRKKDLAALAAKQQELDGVSGGDAINPLHAVEEQSLLIPPPSWVRMMKARRVSEFKDRPEDEVNLLLQDQWQLFCDWRKLKEEQEQRKMEEEVAREQAAQQAQMAAGAAFPFGQPLASAGFPFGPAMGISAQVAGPGGNAGFPFAPAASGATPQTAMGSAAFPFGTGMPMAQLPPGAAGSAGPTQMNAIAQLQVLQSILQPSPPPQQQQDR